MGGRLAADERRAVSWSERRRRLRVVEMGKDSLIRVWKLKRPGSVRERPDDPVLDRMDYERSQPRQYHHLHRSARDSVRVREVVRESASGPRWRAGMICCVRP